MQTPRGALAPEFRSSGRPTKWGDRQQHRSDWDDSPAAVRTLPGTLRKLVVSLATRRGGRCLAGWLGVPLACSSAGACFLGVRGAAGRIRCGLGGLLAKGRGRVPALLLQPPGSRPYGQGSRAAGLEGTTHFYNSLRRSLADQSFRAQDHHLNQPAPPYQLLSRVPRLGNGPLAKNPVSHSSSHSEQHADQHASHSTHHGVP